MLTLVDPLVPRGPNAPPLGFLLTREADQLATVPAPDVTASPETAADLPRFLVQLAAHGVVVVLTDGQLRARSVTLGALSPAIRAVLAGLSPELRAALIELLTTHGCSKCHRFSFPHPTLCHWCRS